MKKYTQKTLILAIFTFLIPTICICSQQRLGLMKGEHTVEPKSMTRIDSYCLDFRREIPNNNSEYRYILSEDDKTKVWVNYESLSLQEAIDQKIVEIRGSDFLTILEDQEFIKSLSTEDKTYYDVIHDILYEELTYEKLKIIFRNPIIRRDLPESMMSLLEFQFKAYDSLSPSEKIQFERQVKPMLDLMSNFMKEMFREMGDYSNIYLVNKTDETLKIEFEDPVILGAKDESIDDIESYISNVQENYVKNGNSKVKTQEQIWNIQK